MAKIIKKKNGQVLHRLMYLALAQEEWEWEECRAELSLFLESHHQRLGPCAMVGDLVELVAEDTLHYNPYEDELQNAEMFPILDEGPVVIPEWGDQYVNAEILLPRVNSMARSQVVHQKQDVDGNTIGRSNQNPILSTHLTELEFPGGEITELAANIIAELMYAKCDVNRNEHLL